MSRPPMGRPHRIPSVVVLAMLAVLAMHAAWPAAAAPAAGPSTLERTMPHLKFVCPAAIGDHTFAGILPDGPAQEQCFYTDGKDSEFAVGATWVTRPNSPGDPYAVCVASSLTVWHQDGSGARRLARFSTARRANAYLYLDLTSPNAEKLARQKGMVAQLEAVGDQMLATAEKLAQPCVEPTPIPSPSSQSPSSQATGPDESPTPSQTGRDELCTALDGRLTDNDDEPVPGVVVRLKVDGAEPVDTTTDDQGRFHFGDIPDTRRSRASGAARLQVLVRDGAGLWRLYGGEAEASLLTTRFALTESTGCRHDLTTTSLRGYETAAPSTTDTWADVWAIVAKTRRALAYLKTTLGVDLRAVPVLVYAWCPAYLSAASCTPTSDAAFATDLTPTAAGRADGIGESGRVPVVALASALADQQAEAPDDDTVYHEFGHILQADLAGGFTRLLAPGRTNHAGYANASSNDSWAEGFASWFAISVDQADGRRSPYYEWENGARLDLEHNIKAWEAGGKDEEWAVAGLLTDLTDSGGRTADLGRPVPFTLTGTGPGRTIAGTATGARIGTDAVVVELYDATGKQIASEDAFLFPDGRFYDVPALDFARALVFVRPSRGGTGRQDDDAFALSPRDLVRTITGPRNIGARGQRPNGSAVVFDIAELHAVLRTQPDRAEDVDALFVAHGFHENLNNENTFTEGDEIGLTTHLPFMPEVTPRYGTEVLPVRYVTVNTGGRQATLVVFPHGGVPYGVTPDATGRVPVMIPGSLDSRVAVLTLADGAQPAVTVIEGKTFWPQAAKHDASFLTIAPEFEPVAAARGNDDRRTWVLTAGAGSALLAFGVGGTLIGLLRRHRRRRSVPSGG